MKHLAVVFFLVLSSVLPAVPYTCLGGMTVPTGYVIPYKAVELGFTNYTAPNVDNDYSYDFAFSVNGGVYHWANIGVVYTGNNVLSLNLKARILEQTDKYPAISIGVDNFFSKQKEDGGNEYEVSDPDDYARNSFYVVISKTALLRGLPFFDHLETYAHFGFGRGRFYGNVPRSKALGGLFGAFELRPSDYYSFLAEMDGHNVNLGINTYYKDYTFRIGIYRLDESYKRDTKLAININYTFDKFVSDKSKNTVRKSRMKSMKNSQVIIQEGLDEQTIKGNPLLKELQEMRRAREETAKELEEIKKFLQEDDE
ncbi:MAG: hypothetical protein CSB55_03665 [Candidatus Cloacimonadota bacterium]|nr:MAG: hypothetical protein CSB55_03665 [Candidatus Cloacimonadota bacterium]